MKPSDRLKDRPVELLERLNRLHALHDKPEQIEMRKRAMPPPSSLDPYTGPMTNKHLAHLLRRSMFGFTKDDLQRFAGMSLDQVLDVLFTPGGDVEPPTNDYVDRSAGEVDPQVPEGETWIGADYDGAWEGRRTDSLHVWWIEQLLNQEPSIHMKLHFFLSSYLVVQTWELFYGKVSYRYWKTLYDNSFSSYRDIIKGLTVDAGMLWYLNGAYNGKEAPDENYAREIQELFCIGKGPDSGFTEADVQMAAKVLTGWKVSWPQADVSFGAWDHDTSDKQFSEFYGHRVIQGRTGAAGAEETDELIDMLLDTEECSKYISRRIYQYFVLPEIDSTIEDTIIGPLAEHLRNNDYNIASAVRLLLGSQHFMTNEVQGAMIKDPMYHMVSLLKRFEFDRHEDESYVKMVRRRALIWKAGDIGMVIGNPPGVSGWPAHYQSPQYDFFWIDTTSITRRAIDTDAVLYWGLWTPLDNYFADVIQFVHKLDNPQDPNLMIQEIADMIYGIDISIETRDQLKAILLTGQATDDYWTNAWFEYTSDPDNQEKEGIVRTRLVSLLQTMMQRPEYQLG